MKKNQSGIGETQSAATSINATVTVRQVGAGGTRLSFTIPVAPAEGQADRGVPVFNRLFQLLSDKRILVVDDNELNRLLAAEILRPYGAIIVEAANGAEAVERLGEHAFDMVLMDVQMPVMDGIDATRIIRRQLGTSLPVIALSADVVSGNIHRCLAAGMNAFLAKPYRAEALMDLVTSHLNP